MWKVRCPSCGAEYSFPEKRVSVVRCLQCGTLMDVEDGDGDKEEDGVGRRRRIPPDVRRRASKVARIGSVRGVGLPYDPMNAVLTPYYRVSRRAFLTRSVLVLLFMGGCGAAPFVGFAMALILLITILPRLKKSYKARFKEDAPRWLTVLTICIVAAIVCWNIVFLILADKYGWLVCGRRRYFVMPVP